MKTVLLNPTILTGAPVLRSERCQGKLLVGLWPPIALAYVGAVLRKEGIEVKIIDSVILNHTFEKMVEAVTKEMPDLIIVQNTTPTLYDDLELAKRVKELLREKIEIAFFGVHATARPEDILCENVKFAIRNEPEFVALDLCRAVREGGQSFGDIQGLSYWRDGKVFHNQDRSPILNLDDLPFPARDLLPNDKYTIPTTGEPFTLIKTSRGCPYECIFCTAPAYYGHRWRTRSAANIVSEVKKVVARFNINNFSFSSDTFNVREDYVLSICEAINSEGMKIKWMCNSRVDNFSVKSARAMKEAGCWLIAFGTESGSDVILQMAKKGTVARQGKEAIEICKDVGIKSLCYFMFGLPGETKQTIRETIDFVMDAEPDYVHFYTATPFPGTEFYRQARDRKWLTSSDWRRYFHGLSDVISYPDLPGEEITEATKIAYRKFYFRPKKIMGEVLNIHSLSGFKGQIKTFLNMVKTWIIKK